MDDDLDSIIDMLNDAGPQKQDPLPQIPKLRNIGLPPLVQRKPVQNGEKLDGLALAHADLKAINEQVMK